MNKPQAKVEALYWILGATESNLGWDETYNDPSNELEDLGMDPNDGKRMYDLIEPNYMNGRDEDISGYTGITEYSIDPKRIEEILYPLNMDSNSRNYLAIYWGGAKEYEAPLTHLVLLREGNYIKELGELLNKYDWIDGNVWFNF